MIDSKFLVKILSDPISTPVLNKSLWNLTNVSVLLLKGVGLHGSQVHHREDPEKPTTRTLCSKEVGQH